MPVIAKPRAKEPKQRTKVVPFKLALPSVIDDLVEAQRRRRFCIVSQSRCDRSIEAYIATDLGYVPRAPDSSEEEEGKRRHEDPVARAIFAKAKEIRKAVEGGKPLPAKVEIPSATIDMIKTSALARHSWDAMRSDVEARMVVLAGMLPPGVIEFVRSVKGAGEKGLAVIVGESRNLSDYPTVAKLWKRLGYAVIKGERQQKKKDKQAAAEHGFSPERHAEIWVLAESMLKAQICGEKRAYLQAIMADKSASAYCTANHIVLTQLDLDKELKPLAKKFGIKASRYAEGPYGEYYLHRRRCTDNRGWDGGHVHQDACRYMMKRYLCDLWRVWHGNLPRGADTSDIRNVAA
jgi:hypothetical protein